MSYEKPSPKPKGFADDTERDTRHVRRGRDPIGCRYDSDGEGTHDRRVDDDARLRSWAMI